MITDKDMAAKSRKLRGLLQEKFSVRGKTLQQSLRRAGRRLPRGVRKSGAVLVEAEMQAQIPKIARQIDEPQVKAAFEHMRVHLENLDVGEMRKGRLLSLTGAIAANILFVAVVFIVWLWWRGYV